jgi:4-hydroxythreonine-4-phosphate dehydrogenase
MTTPLILTMGEPAGIGGEIALAAWRARDQGVPAFCLVDDPRRIEALAASTGLATPVRAVKSVYESMSAWPQALPVLPQALAAPVVAGKPDPANASAVIAAIERGVDLVTRGEAAALVTNPIQKQTLYAAGFSHPGHTEFLAALAGSGVEPVMMLACPGLRVVPVTVHIPLRDVPSRLSSAAIISAGRITAASLRRDFGISNPRLAIAGLNPHAGEAGTLGDEESRILAPAVKALREEGIAISDPAPADSLFHAAARSRYDAVLCMYHDQALIPLKTIDFDRGVNVTLGLPFVRTSPDHGTALDIAGTGKANAESLIAALELAAEMAQARARSSAP